MTVSLSSRTVSYIGNGSATDFTIPFPVPNADTLYVYLRLTAGAEEELVPPSSYFLTLFDGVGGTVTYPTAGAPLTAEQTIVIKRKVPYTQPMDLVNQSGFFPDVVEHAMDWLEMQIQQQAEFLTALEDSGFNVEWIEEIDEARDQAIEAAAIATISKNGAQVAAASAANSAAAAQVALQDILASGKVLRSGPLPPSNGEGNNGDFYIDHVAWNIYGPKELGDWGFPTSIRGPQGEPGEDGVLGSVWYTGFGAPSSGLGVPPDFYLDSVSGDFYEKTASGWVVRGNLRGPSGAGAGDMLKSDYDTDGDNVVNAAETVAWVGVTGVPDFLLKAGGTMTGPLLTAPAVAGAAGFQFGYSTALPSPGANGDAVVTVSGFTLRYGGVWHLFGALDTSNAWLAKQVFQGSGTAAPILIGAATPSAFADGDVWRQDSSLRTRLSGQTKQFAFLEDILPPLPPAYLTGLTLANSAVLPNVAITVGTGECSSLDNTYRIVLAVALRKLGNSVWAAGEGNGGLDVLPRAVSSWYHVFVIANPTTLVVDVLFSLSPSTPTLPTGFTQYRRVGAFYVQSDNTNKLFTQRNDMFLWKTANLDWEVTNPTTTETLRPLLVPVGLELEALFTACHYTGNNQFSVLWSSPLIDPQTVQNPSTSSIAGGFDNVVAGATSTWQKQDKRLFVNASAQVRVRCSSTNSTNKIAAITRGWVDRRGATTTGDSFTAPLMGPSGPDHRAGIVPDPGATAGTVRFLREDATWTAPIAVLPSMNSGKVLGRANSGLGTAEEITVAGGLTLTVVDGLRRAALTGDVTAAEGSNTTAISTTLATTINGALQKSGGTMTGQITLPGGGTGSQAITVGEVDTLLSSQNTAISNRVLRAGDTMLGPLVLAADPAEDLQAATKQYVDLHGGGSTYVHPNHSGDVVSLGDGATTIQPGVVTLAKMADIVSGTVIGRTSLDTGVPELLGKQALKDLVDMDHAAFAGPTATRTFTLPDRDAIIVDLANTQNWQTSQPLFNGATIGGAAAGTGRQATFGNDGALTLRYGDVNSVTVPLSLRNHGITGVGYGVAADYWIGRDLASEVKAAQFAVQATDDFTTVAKQTAQAIIQTINAGVLGTRITLNAGGALIAGTLTASGNVAATGSVSGSNLSGSNTGDQTIMLTGDVTGSGTSTIATEIAEHTIGYDQSALVTLGNLAPNPQFNELGVSSLAGWVGTGTSVPIISDVLGELDGYVGDIFGANFIGDIFGRDSASVQSTCPAPWMCKFTGGVAEDGLIQEYYVPCRPGEDFYLGVDIACDIAVASGIYLTLQQRSAAGTAVYDYVQLPALAAGVWTHFEYKITARVNTAEVCWRLMYFPANVPIYFTNCVLERYITYARLPSTSTVFTTTANGLVPMSGAADTTKFLNAAGGWTVPSGSGTGLANAYASVTAGAGTTTAGGADTLTVASSDGSILPSVSSSPDTLNLTVNTGTTAAAIMPKAGGRFTGSVSFFTSDFLINSNGVGLDRFIKLNDAPYVYVGADPTYTVEGVTGQFYIATERANISVPMNAGSGDVVIDIPVKLLAAPTDPLHAATTGYVNTKAAVLASMTSNRILGRNTDVPDPGPVEQLTGTDVNTILPVFTSALKGLAPESGGGTAKFLRADGTWASPSTKISPFMYGAVGDGVADDTAEVQAALDAWDAAGGGVMDLTGGVFRITGLVSVALPVGNFVIRADGPYAGAIIGGTPAAGIKISAASNRTSLHIKDCTIAPGCPVPVLDGSNNLVFGSPVTQLIELNWPGGGSAQDKNMVALDNVNMVPLDQNSSFAMATGWIKMVGSARCIVSRCTAGTGNEANAIYDWTRGTGTSAGTGTHYGLIGRAYSFGKFYRLQKVHDANDYYVLGTGGTPELIAEDTDQKTFAAALAVGAWVLEANPGRKAGRILDCSETYQFRAYENRFAVYADIGYYKRDTSATEGFFIHNNWQISADYGIWLERNGREPGLYINHNHINSRVTNAVIDGAKTGEISGNMLYNNHLAQAVWTRTAATNNIVVTTWNEHHYAVGDQVYMTFDTARASGSGNIPFSATDYEGLVTVTAVTTNTFTFVNTGGGIVTATGNCTTDYSYAEGVDWDMRNVTGVAIHDNGYRDASRRNRIHVRAVPGGDAAPTAWVTGTSYLIGQVKVAASGTVYKCLKDHKSYGTALSAAVPNWVATSTAYAVNNFVQATPAGGSKGTYKCLIAHNSSDYATFDLALAAGRWILDSGTVLWTNVIASEVNMHHEGLGANTNIAPFVLGLHSECCTVECPQRVPFVDSAVYPSDLCQNLGTNNIITDGSDILMPPKSVVAAATTNIAACFERDILVTPGGASITSFGTAPVGRTYRLTFQLTPPTTTVITHGTGANQILCPGGGSIAVTAGSQCEVVSMGDRWRIFNFQRYTVP